MVIHPCSIGRTILSALAVTLIALGVAEYAYAQGKIRIAVTAFENKVKTPIPDSSWKIGEGLAEMLTSELAKTGQFIVVERQALGDIVKEQELGQSGLIRGESATRTGQVLGAQIVVRGARTPALMAAFPNLPYQGGDEHMPLRLELKALLDRRGS